MEAIQYGNMATCNIRDHFRNKERAVFRTQFFSCKSVGTCFFFEGMDTTDADTKNNAYTILVDGIQVHVRIADSHFCGSYCVLGIQVHLSGFFAVDIVAYVEILHFTSELCLEQGSVKMGDRTSTAHAVNHVLPGFLSSVA